jgi:hypothetical protein
LGQASKLASNRSKAARLCSGIAEQKISPSSLCRKPVPPSSGPNSAGDAADGWQSGFRGRSQARKPGPVACL